MIQLVKAIVKMFPITKSTGTTFHRGVPRCNGVQNHNRHNGYAYKPVENGVQIGVPNGATYPIPHTTVNVNVIEMKNSEQSDATGTHETNGEECGQTPINEEVIDRDVKEDKTLAKGIAESGESTNGIPETSAPEDKGLDSPIVTECTDDQTQNHRGLV
ncbi:uncharacterized protein [Ptychodera flava]|uniref:uncharacterized protein n=1 Tax=Ptychodera flava TaxID=63121 RepID=UPI00396A090B